MNERYSSQLNPVQALSWEMLLSGIDLNYDWVLQKGRDLDAFYAELGWDAEAQANFFYETLSVTKISKGELEMLLDKELEAFIQKCQPLFVLLVNSMRREGQSDEI